MNRIGSRTFGAGATLKPAGARYQFSAAVSAPGSENTAWYSARCVGRHLAVHRVVHQLQMVERERRLRQQRRAEELHVATALLLIGVVRERVAECRDVRNRQARPRPQQFGTRHHRRPTDRGTPVVPNEMELLHAGRLRHREHVFDQMRNRVRRRAPRVARRASSRADRTRRRESPDRRAARSAASTSPTFPGNRAAARRRDRCCRDRRRARGTPCRWRRFEPGRYAYSASSIGSAAVSARCW